MYRLALIITNVIIFSSAKVVEFEGNELDKSSGSNEVSWTIYDNHGISENDKLWVLDLNDEGLDSLKLRGATDQDEEDFEFHSGPLIEEFNKRQSTVVKKDSPKTTNPEVFDKPVTKKDIFKYLNKYSLYSKTEPDSYLSDSHEADEPSITLNFKGPFTSLVVNFGMRQWHYFISPPASRFPSWFYEDHTPEVKASSVEVPDDVKEKFYPALSRLLQVVLTYPL